MNVIIRTYTKFIQQSVKKFSAQTSRDDEGHQNKYILLNNNVSQTHTQY